MAASLRERRGGKEKRQPSLPYNVSHFRSVRDDEAVAGIQLLAETEGIILALESAHVSVSAASCVPRLRSGETVVMSEMVRRIQAISPVPVGVDFGISSPDQAAEVAQIADAVIVGSAIMVDHRKPSGTSRPPAPGGEMCRQPEAGLTRAGQPGCNSSGHFQLAPSYSFRRDTCH